LKVVAMSLDGTGTTGNSTCEGDTVGDCIKHGTVGTRLVQVFDDQPMEAFQQEEAAAIMSPKEARTKKRKKSYTNDELIEMMQAVMESENAQYILNKLKLDIRAQPTELLRSDSNDDDDNPTDGDPLKTIFTDELDLFEVSATDKVEPILLVVTSPPATHDLLSGASTPGVMYRGVPNTPEGAVYWKEREVKIHHQVMAARIMFSNSAPTRVSQDISLALASFWNMQNPKPDNLEKLLKDSSVFALLHNVYPLSDKIKSKWSGFKESVGGGASMKLFCTILPCISFVKYDGEESNKDAKKKSRETTTSKNCKCGAIMASIAKGLHQKGDNPHLKVKALEPHLPKIDDFRTRLHAATSCQTKVLLCLWNRIYIHSITKGNDGNKFCLIGTDQRPNSLFGSDGCQPGMIPFCLETLQVLYGKWYSWSAMQNLQLVNQSVPDDKNRTEQSFKQFMDGCLQYKKGSELFSSQRKIKLCIWYNGLVGQSNSTAGGKNSMNNGTYRRRRFNNILMNFCSRTIVEKGDVIMEDFLPKLEPYAQLVRQWYKGEVYPITKSLSLHAATFYQKLTPVREILGLSGGTQYVSQAGRQKMSGMLTKIASHRIQYLWGSDEYGHVNPDTNIVWMLQDKNLFLGPKDAESDAAGDETNSDEEEDGDPETGASKLKRIAKEEELMVKQGEEEKTLLCAGNIPSTWFKIGHAANVTVHPLDAKVTQILFSQVAEIAVGPVPERTGQKFGDLEMRPYSPSTHTLFKVTAWGGDQKDDSHHDTGLHILVNSFLTGEAGKQVLMTMQNELVDHFTKELRNNHVELGLCKDQKFDKYLNASYVHSRFDTTIIVRPAPHIEMTLACIHEQMKQGTYVKNFVVPGSEGVWLRFFSGQKDFRGRLIKLEPDSILGYPSTAIIEVGRISHIEGNPYYLIQVVLKAQKDDGGQSRPPNPFPKENFHLTYPHLLGTVKKMRKSARKKSTDGRLPPDWEKSLRTVAIHPINVVRDIIGLEKKHLDGLQHLSSQETREFDKSFQI
jgi:hypothetical protein